MWNKSLIIIKAGQFVTGRKKLSEETGIPEGTIEDILTLFEKEQQIQQQKTTKFRLITVINWENHQVEQQQGNNKATTSRHKQECKKEENEKKESRQSRFPKTLSAFRDIRRVESGRPPMEKRMRTPKENEAFEELRGSDIGFGFYKRRAMEEHGLDFSAVEEGDNSRLRKQQRSVKAKLTPRGETIEQFYEWILTGGHPFAKKVIYDPTVCISDILLNAFINRTVQAKETIEDMARRLLESARKRGATVEDTDETDYRMWARGDFAKELSIPINDLDDNEEYKKVKHIIGN